MKSLVYIAILLFSISTLAQKPMNKRTNPDFTPEQHAELQSKQLALALDLTEKQQKEVKALQLERAKESKANHELRQARRGKGERPSQDELFALRTKNLDAQEAHQEKMKKILSDDQYKEWKDLKKERMQRMENRRQSKRMDQNKTNQSKGSKIF